MASTYVTSARNVTIKGNRFVNAQQVPPNVNGRDFGMPNDCIIWISQSENVTFSDNQIVNPGPFAKKTVVVDASKKRQRVPLTS